MNFEFHPAYILDQLQWLSWFLCASTQTYDTRQQMCLRNSTVIDAVVCPKRCGRTLARQRSRDITDACRSRNVTGSCVRQFSTKLHELFYALRGIIWKTTIFFCYLLLLLLLKGGGSNDLTVVAREAMRPRCVAVFFSYFSRPNFVGRTPDPKADYTKTCGYSCHDQEMNPCSFDTNLSRVVEGVENFTLYLVGLCRDKENRFRFEHSPLN